MKTSDGWLLGFDAGEFGGGLWYWDDSGGRVKRLLEENVHTLVQRNGVALVLTGLAHMDFDHGTMYAYHAGRAGASGSLLRIADLGSSPGAAALDADGTLFIVTHRAVLRFGTNDVLEPLYANGALSPLYPNSILPQKGGQIFVGMRFYVLEIALEPHKVRSARWFVRSECKTMEVKGFDCICTEGHGN